MRRKKSLKYSIIDGAAFSYMAGFVENFIVPFSLLFNATAQQISFIAAWPQLISGVVQLKAADITDRMKKRRKLMLASVLLQMLSLIPLFLIPALTGSVYSLILFFTLYFAAGQFAGVPWNSVIGDLVRPQERGDFFGKRSQINGVVAFASMLLAGFVLGLFNESLFGYGLIFFTAVIARLISLYFLSKMYVPKYRVRNKDYFSLYDFCRRAPKSNFASFTFFIALIRVSVNIAAPFCALYLIKDLGFSVFQYSILTAASAIAGFLSMHYWGKNADIFGNKGVFSATAFAIAVVPFVIAITTNFYLLLIAWTFSGFVWAGFNLSTTNFLLDACSSQKRARCTSYYVFMFDIGNFAGAILGGILIAFMPLLHSSPIPTLFLISGIARVILAIMLSTKISEVRDVKTDKNLFLKLIAVKPLEGLIYAPMQFKKKNN